MTRFLSESLQAPEPSFRTALHRLEAANGNPNTDIRFSSEVVRATKVKLMELGLDPHDTTAEELYHALQVRIKADDARLVKTLRTRAATYVSADGDVVAGMVHALQSLPDSTHCFALKASSLRGLMKKQPPKKAIKKLGYRSLDSFLKHESPVSMLASAWLTEGAVWQKRFVQQYAHLSPGDFEDRHISISRDDFKRWKGLAQDIVAHSKHNVLSFKELGALVILPFPATVPDGAVTASLTLALHELNEIRAASTFLKLSQVRADFGKVVQKVAAGEPELTSKLLDQPVSWKLIQRYYAHFSDRFQEAIFEPYVQLEDMVWHPVEKALAQIEPSLAFWQDSAHLGLLHQRRPVSFNIVDAAINFCNDLPFEKRVVHYFQRSLWHELLLRYLQHDTVKRTVLAELQPELAIEAVAA
jgi:hypothetical protein